MFTCPRCDYRTAQFTLFFKHCIRKRTCKLVGDRQPVDLTEHIETLKSERQAKKKFTCDICNNKYSSKPSLKVHMKKFHQDYTIQVTKTASSFGQEDLMYLFNNNNVRKIVEDANTTIQQKVSFIIAMAYFDDQHKENNVFRVVQQGKLEILQDGSWVEAANYDDTLSCITEKIKMIVHYYDDKIDIDNIDISCIESVASTPTTVTNNTNDGKSVAVEDVEKGASMDFDKVFDLVWSQ